MKQAVVTLSNNYSMPVLGFGTYGLKKEDTKACIVDAIAVGYRHIETAPIYLNLSAINEGIKASGIKREALFITSKIPPHIKTYDSTLRMAKKIMKDLGVDYLDALLINNPVPWGKEGEDYTKENREVWRALEDLYTQEVVGAIGVSNFDIPDLEDLIKNAKIIPHINQVGIFIGHTLDALRAFCASHTITVMAHSPLARGRLLTLPSLTAHAKALGVTNSQLALKYTLLNNTYPVVKASTKAKMIENLALDFNVPQAVIQALDAINEDVRDYLPPNAKSVL